MNAGRVLTRPETGPLAALALILLGLGLTTPALLAPANLAATVTQVAVTGVVALALNQVILAGEIDVSVGSLLALCAVTFGVLAPALGLLLSLAAALAVGAGVGALTGLLVTVGRVPSIIVTLGMLLALRGIVLLLGADGVVLVPDAARGLGLGTVLGVPAPGAVLALTFVALSWVNRETVWGRDLLAVGGALRAAQAVGLPTGLVTFWTFVATGLGCGLASAVFAGQTGEIQATAGTGFELQCIAAVVLGGTSIKGGRGSTLAPVIGAILVGVILNAMTLNGVPGIYEQLVLGLLVLSAVSFEALGSRWLRRSA